MTEEETIRPLDIHDKTATLKANVALLKDDPRISKREKDLILEYADERKSRSGHELTDSRKEKIVRILRLLRGKIDKDFDETNDKEIITLVKELKDSPAIYMRHKKDKDGNKVWREVKSNKTIKPWTYRDYGLILKGYLTWLKKRKGERLSEDLKERLTFPAPTPEELTQDKIITWDDVLRLCQVAQNPRDKAFVKTLWDSGMRITEALTLNLSDVEIAYGGECIILHIRKSKTKPRPVAIPHATAALMQWIDSHPYRNSSDRDDAPLWTDLEKGERLAYRAAAAIPRRLARLAHFKKPVNPHQFRKSGASFFGHQLTESELCARFGWVQGSDMMRVYCHLDSDRVNKKVAKEAGLDVDDDKEPIKIPKDKQKRICYRCDAVNMPEAESCLQCGMNLDPSTWVVATSLEAEREKLRHDMRQEMEMLVQEYLPKRKRGR